MINLRRTAYNAQRSRRCYSGEPRAPLAGWAANEYSGWERMTYKHHDRTARVHVVPCNDLRSHVEVGVECWCRPTVETDGVVVHNALDQRELVEQGDRMIQ